MKEFKPQTERVRVTNIQEGFTRYSAWPTVCKDDRGVLYAGASSLRMSHVDPCGKNCMFVSLNEGKTWSPPIIINDTYCDDRDVGLCYMGNGKLLMSSFTEIHPEHWEHLTTAEWFDKYDREVSGGYTRAYKLFGEERYKSYEASFVKVSEDYGITWSDRITVPVTCPHGPSVCKDGTLVYMGKQMDPEYRSFEALHVYSSHDGGYTWEFTGEVPAGDGDANFEAMHEPHVIELPNGRLLGAIRTHTATEFTVYITFSDDKGKTWSKPRGIGVDGAPPHLMVHSSGAILCSYSCRTWGKIAERVCVSYDNGETWEEDYEIDNLIPEKQHDMGYPSTVELSDGSLLTLYYQAWGDEDMCSIICSRWRLNGK